MATQSAKWNRFFIALIVSAICFALGLTILHLNPYWRSEPEEPGTLHHKVYAWNAFGHLLCALGMSSLLTEIASWLSRAFKAKWLYWSGIACCMTLWIAKGGFAEDYQAQFAWDKSTGLIEFRVQPQHGQTENALWQTIVRLQVQHELNGYLGASDLWRAEGKTSVTVLRIVPIAVPTALGSGGEWFKTQVWIAR
jgi:hypothetical protein